MSLIYKSLVNGSLRDASGNNNGTLTAGTSRGFVQTNKGLALEFDGADTKVNTGSDFIGTSACTISAWIYLNGWGEDTLGRICDNIKTIFWVSDSNSQLRFVSNGLSTVTSSSDILTLNKWYYIVITRTSTGVTNFYVNNSLSGTADQDSGTPDSSGTSNVIIGNSNAGTRAFDGYISNVKIYDEVIDANKRAELYDEFARAHQTVKTKRNFQKPKPTDLSGEVKDTVGDNLLAGWDFESGWTPSNSTINNSTQYTVSANLGDIRKSYLTIGKRYKMHISGTASTGSFRVDNPSPLFAFGTSTVDEIVEFTAASDIIYIIAQTNGAQITITSLEITELTGLFAAYNMVPSNGRLVDISNNGNNGTITGAVSTKDGLHFNGVDGKVTVSGISEDLVTINMRVKLDATPTGNGTSLFTFSTDTVIRCFVNSSGRIAIRRRNSGGSYDDVNMTSTGVILANNYYNLSFILNKTSATVQVYVDGIDYGVNDATSFYDSFAGLNFGYSSSYNYLDGEIVDAKIYNRALTALEAQDYHNSFNTPTLLEDFSDASADDKVTQTPREWISGTGSYKIGEYVMEQGEKVTNGDFTDNITGWTRSSGDETSTITHNSANGTMNVAVTSIGTNSARPLINGTKTALVVGKRYRFSFEVIVNSGACKIYGYTIDAAVVLGEFLQTGKYSYEFTATGTSANVYIYLDGRNLFDVDFDNVSVTEIPPLPGWD